MHYTKLILSPRCKCFLFTRKRSLSIFYFFFFLPFLFFSSSSLAASLNQIIVLFQFIIQSQSLTTIYALSISCPFTTWVIMAFLICLLLIKSIVVSSWLLVLSINYSNLTGFSLYPPFFTCLQCALS